MCMSVCPYIAISQQPEVVEEIQKNAMKNDDKNTKMGLFFVSHGSVLGLFFVKNGVLLRSFFCCHGSFFLIGYFADLI